MDSILRKIAIETANAHLAVRQIAHSALTQKVESSAISQSERAAAYRRLAEIELESRRLEDEMELLVAEN
ncbi:MAG: hypothetical protein ABR928_05085 [Terracidiphilus sp.]